MIQLKESFQIWEFNQSLASIASKHTTNGDSREDCLTLSPLRRYLSRESHIWPVMQSIIGDDLVAFESHYAISSANRWHRLWVVWIVVVLSLGTRKDIMGWCLPQISADPLITHTQSWIFETESDPNRTLRARHVLRAVNGRTPVH